MALISDVDVHGYAGMQTNATAAVARSVRERVARIHAIPVGDVEALIVGTCCYLGNCDDVIELVCSRSLASRVREHKNGLAISTDEFVAMLSVVAARGIEGSVASNELFRERRTRVERAMLCTLTESAGKSAWSRAAVQVATVVAFQSREPPFDALTALFGSVVRSDVRRCEDLHYAESTDAMDTVLCAALVEAIVGVALGGSR